MNNPRFLQTNYIVNTGRRTEIKLCPICKTTFPSNEDDCIKCNLYLPSFPTSWARSATNIFLLRRVLEYILNELNEECNPKSLALLLTQKHLISFDEKRKNDKKYWRGGPQRRASEYLSNLQYLGFIIKIKKNWVLTRVGKKIATAKKFSEYLTYFSDAFMNLKVGNEFDNRDFYKSYNNHILFQCLRIIDDLNKKKKNPTIENLALAIMAKNEQEEYAKALNISLKYKHTKIKELWFSKGKEFARVVQGVFIRWLNQVKMISQEKKERTIFVNLTKFGKNIFEKYKKIYLFSKNIEFSENTKNIVEVNLEKRYLNLLILNDQTSKSGKAWEEKVRVNFNKIGLKVVWYNKNSVFANIELPAEITVSLTGGSRHNPDLILRKPLWLIDPKKNVNQEMHKVVAYDKYAKIVNGLSIIVSQEIMKKKEILKMKEMNLKNVLVIDGNALQVLSENSDYFNENKVIEIFNKSIQNSFYYLNEESIFYNFIE